MDDNVLNFFKDITRKIDEKTISQEEYHMIFEAFQQCSINKLLESVSDVDLLKYLTMGWFVYQNISFKSKDESKDE